MRLLILTSNQPRHRACVHALAAHELLVIVEPKPLRRDHPHPAMRDYWQHVDAAECAIFGQDLAMCHPIAPVVVDGILALARPGPARSAKEEETPHRQRDERDR